MDSESLWSAVKLAKEAKTSLIPNEMNYHNGTVSGEAISDCFTDIFESKVSNIVANAVIEEGIFNGVQIKLMRIELNNRE